MPKTFETPDQKFDAAYPALLPDPQHSVSALPPEPQPAPVTAAAWRGRQASG